MQKLSLTVIMPALNEENNISSAITGVLQSLDKSGIDYEIIVINDGSTDNTGTLAQNFADKNNKIKLINHDIRLGIGFAFKEGVRVSSKDVVVLFPGDNENNTHDALSFFHLMNDVDVIIPFIHNTGARSLKRRVLSAIFNFIINISFSLRLAYTNGTVFFRKSVLDGIDFESSGFFYQTEILVKLIKTGYLYAQVPNFLSKRMYGKSKALTLKSFAAVMKGYICLLYGVYIKRILYGKKVNEDSVTYKKINE